MINKMLEDLVRKLLHHDGMYLDLRTHVLYKLVDEDGLPTEVLPSYSKNTKQCKVYMFTGRRDIYLGEITATDSVFEELLISIYKSPLEERLDKIEEKIDLLSDI